MVFLMETKKSVEEMARIRRVLGFFDGFFVDAVGRSGGLGLLWSEALEVQIQSSSVHHIDCHVKGLFGEDMWRFTGFYGWADKTQKHLSWELLRHLGEECELPWLVTGDFNQILFDLEKQGGPPRDARELMAFREALDDCSLQDVGYMGESFTWWHRQAEPNDVMERLDRGVATLGWIEKYPYVTVHHLQYDNSDHRPIKLAAIPKAEEFRRKKKKFRFEDMWLSSPDCEQVVKRAWGGANEWENGQDVLEKIKRCSMELSRWNKEEFGNINTKIKEVRWKIVELDGQPTEHMVQERRSLCEELDKLIYMEEVKWRQRSRVIKLKEGDQNTKFFHVKASGRRRRNMINGIKREDGMFVTDEDEISDVAINYFSNLFTTMSPHNFEAALAGMDAKCQRR